MINMSNIIIIALGLIGMICGVFLFLNNDGEYRKTSIPLFIVGVCAIVAGCSYSFVPSGYVGVRTAYGQISEKPTSPGMNWHIPFVEKIHNINCKQQEKDFGSLKIWSETSERTEVYCENVVVDYQINSEFAAWIWINVEEWDNNLVKQTSIESGIKAATKMFNDTDVTDRSKIEGAAKERIQISLDEKYGNRIVNIVSVTIGNINFSDAYNAAIEKKAQAKLSAETAEYVNKQNMQKTQAEAEQLKINATAEAEVNRIKAEQEAENKKIKATGEAESIRIKAEAQAEANKKIADSLTPELIEQQKIESWDGKLPVISGDSVPIINFDSVIK